jgi:hypothetical protein
MVIMLATVLKLFGDPLDAVVVGVALAQRRIER